MNESIIDIICMRLLGWNKKEFCCGWHWYKGNNQVAPKAFNPISNLRDAMIVFKSFDRATIDKMGDQYLVVVPIDGTSIKTKDVDLNKAIVNTARKLIGAGVELSK